MAKNDKVLIDGIIDDRVANKLPSDKRDEAFEFFCFEQILKNYDLSRDELEEGIVDGRNDGGIDGIYIIINGHLLSEIETFNWPKAGATMDIWIITCKHHDTFKQSPLDNLAASISELLDFSIHSDDLKGSYSTKVKKFRESLLFAYRRISSKLNHFSIYFSYASRGNSDEIGESILSRASQIKEIAKTYFSSCSNSFQFLGSTELINHFRQSPKFTIELPFTDNLSSGETYILLTSLENYYNFIQEEGRLRRHLFDSNVRAFMGINAVNSDIQKTLNTDSSPDFWWLNNGVTILATGATVIGKAIQIRNIQIVNGLQTSETIFRHFQGGGKDVRNRSVLVKVIVSNDLEVRDAIIRATNNQTSVEISALHATDKIQRDIEDVLKRNEWYYERRTNFYKNQGITSDKIITPLYLAAGYINLVLKAPIRAASLKSKFMRSDESYQEIFSPDTNLNVWPKIASILKATDSFLETVRPKKTGESEYFLKHRRQILSFLVTSRILDTFSFSFNDLLEVNLSSFTHEILDDCWEVIFSSDDFKKTGKKISWRQGLEILTTAKMKWDIRGINRFEKGQLSYQEQQTSSFAMKINALLPPQPWKPGIDKEIIDKLGCTKDDYFWAVEMLVEMGIRYRQKDGIVYDIDGKIVAFDEARVDPNTMRLRPTNPNHS